jgi:hypothetical protein
VTGVSRLDRVEKLRYKREGSAEEGSDEGGKQSIQGPLGPASGLVHIPQKEARAVMRQISLMKVRDISSKGLPIGNFVGSGYIALKTSNLRLRSGKRRVGEVKMGMAAIQATVCRGMGGEGRRKGRRDRGMKICSNVSAKTTAKLCGCKDIMIDTKIIHKTIKIMARSKVKSVELMKQLSPRENWNGNAGDGSGEAKKRRRRKRRNRGFGSRKMERMSSRWKKHGYHLSRKERSASLLPIATATTHEFYF